MIGFWQKKNLDDYLINLKDYYQHCENPTFRLSHKIDTLTEEERNYINANIDLENIVGVDRTKIVNKLLSDVEKFNFARYLLMALNIEISVNELLDNKSTFQLLVENLIKRSDYQPDGLLLFSLYKRGYTKKPSDEHFLKQLYPKLPSQDAFITWCVARFAFLLNDAAKLEKVLKNDRVLFSILSFKLKKPIGIGYPNLLGIANNAIQHYREQGDLILHAMKKYEVYDDILARDKKGVFRQKKTDYEDFKPIQDKEFSEIAFLLFPELNS